MEMTKEERKQRINDLVERLNAADLEKRAMDLVIQEILRNNIKYKFSNCRAKK